MSSSTALSASIAPITSGVASKLSPTTHRVPRHEHSVLRPPDGLIYTIISIAIFLVFFYQPHSWRVALWKSIRPVIPDERLFLLVGLLLSHGLVFIIANLVMTAIYYVEHPFFEQFKIQSKPWPWKRGKAERDAYFALIRKSILLVFFNQYVITPILLWTSYAGQKKAGMNGDIDNVPYWYTTLIHITICMVIEDTLFYWAHRALHHPAIYGPVHKVHHSYKTSIGLASEYAHPIEFIFSNAVPFSTGPLLCGVLTGTGMHYLSFFMWSMLRTGETVDGHSGFEFPWSPYRLLPFSGSSTAHDFHHSVNIGNYASFFTWWDHWMGTDQAFKRWEAKMSNQQTEKSTSKDPTPTAAPAPTTAHPSASTSATTTDAADSTTEPESDADATPKNEVADEGIARRTRSSKKKKSRRVE